MAVADKRASVAEFVDLERGLISREIFASEDLYRQEQEQIFARAWLFVGHESQVPNPGDYFVSCMGEESAILTRDMRGHLHVFLNTCRHRGMKVCRYDEGNSTFFTCPYHGWSYANDGRLVTVPYFEEAYHAQLDKSRRGLIEVAQLATYKGTVWATWGRDAPSFHDYLGEMRLHLDQLVDCRDGREGGSELIGGVQKWRISCNWKLAAENFIGDFYHGFSHKSVDAIGIAPSGRARRDSDVGSPRRWAISYQAGHGTVCSIQETSAPYRPLFENIPAVADYLRRAHEQRQQRVGKATQLQAAVGTIFPNMSFHPTQPRSIVVWHPRGPLLTEAWRFYLVDEDAPEEVKEALRHYYLRYSGPAGMTEQDDMENWHYATAASRGTIARRYPYSYEMGLGFEDPAQIDSALVCEGICSEQNQRGFYRRWAELMDKPPA